MPTVTKDLFPHLFDIAKVFVETGKRDRPIALENMNETTFQAYTNFISVLLTGLSSGEGIRRTMSAGAVEYVLERIASENGAPRLANALKVFDEHVVYLEKQYGGRKHKFQEISRKYNARLKLLSEVMAVAGSALDADGPRLPSRDQLDREFQAKIMRATMDSAAIRRARLSGARKKSDTRTVTVRVFIRNPDVVAEALFLANGKCGHCGKNAPFRRLDGREFLEVHHIIPLAEDGDDSVENARALCPNCHREAHFGENWLDFRQ